MVRKIIGVIVLCVLLAGAICGLVYGVKYNDLKHTDQVQKYDQLSQENEELKAAILNLEEECDDLSAQIYSLTIENDANKAKVSSLEALKESLLNQAEIDEQALIDLQAQIDQYNAEIASLDAQIASLESNLTRISALLDNYVISLVPTEEEFEEYKTMYRMPMGGRKVSHFDTILILFNAG